MKIGLIAAAAAAGVLMAGAAHAVTFADFVSVTVPGHDTVTFTSFSETDETFTGLTALPINFTEGTVLLTDPNGTVSDILTLLVGTNGGLAILFASDLEAGAASGVPILPNQLSIAETGGIQDVSDFFGPSGSISVQVGSDVGETRSVPEPAAWTMMLVGLGLAGGALRARRKIAATV